jgi:hypothetical protein
MFEQCECGLEDRTLARCVAGDAQRVTVLEGDGQGAGRSDALGDLAKENQNHRGDPLTFQFGCYQTHGLIAHRSHRNE